MMKLIKMVIVSFLGLSVILSAVAPDKEVYKPRPKESKSSVAITEVCIRNYCFNVEIAATVKERKKGLMMRKQLRADYGMLFIFDHLSKYSFWMKNTLIPLDIIWINDKFEIVHVQKNAAPCLGDDCAVYSPNDYAKYVLEINGGLLDMYRIRIGDRVTFNGQR